MSTRTWKKILYENQGYPDNYTDETFLHEMRKNINIKHVQFPEAVQESLVLIQEVCTVIMFVLVYVFLYNNQISPDTVLCSSCAIISISLIVYRVTSKSANFSILSNDMRTVLIFLVFGHLFSPVLYTLTDTISTDTIYTMACVMMLIHLLFCDYGVPAAIISNSLSLSAAIFASVCLASRLPSAYHAFALLTTAIKCFVLFPYVRFNLRNSYIVIISQLLIVGYLLYYLSTTLTVIFLSVVIFVNIICPFLFVRFQSYKENIYGPWDEAIVDDADNLIS